MSDDFLIPPPSSAQVDYERKAVLYLANGRPLVRRAGFAMSQPSSVNPSLGDRVKKTVKHPIRIKKR